MTVRQELKSLNPLKPRSSFPIVVGIIAAMALAYFLDGARVLAFGILPVVCIRLLSEQTGMAWKTTPKLWMLTNLVGFLIVAASVAWVVAFPRI